jgi:hypothetical protein
MRARGAFGKLRAVGQPWTGGQNMPNAVMLEPTARQFDAERACGGTNGCVRERAQTRPHGHS